MPGGLVLESPEMGDLQAAALLAALHLAATNRSSCDREERRSLDVILELPVQIQRDIQSIAPR